MASIARAAKAAKPLLPELVHGQKVGVVVSAGKMMGAVKVRVAEQEWNKKFRKHFPAPKTYLVKDPNSSLVPGDVVRISSGNRSSKAINHVVTSIVAPFGEPVENRPPVLSQPQLDEQRMQDRLLKDVRAAHRGRQTSIQRIQQARKQGLHIPSLQDALAKGKAYEADLKARGLGAADEAHKGQSGQGVTAKQRRVAQGKKTAEEVKAEGQVKALREQRAS